MPPTETIPHPFRPRLTVRVGVAGHRWNKIKPRDAGAIRERLHHVFGWIEFLVDEVHGGLHSGYRSADPDAPLPEPPILRVLSGLAEGTDRLGARVARNRPRPWQLTALLPFGRDRYVKDFKLKQPRPDGTEISFAPGEAGHGQLDPASVEDFEELLRAAQKEGGIQELDGNPDKPGGYRQLGTVLCLNSDVVIAVWDGEPARPGGTGDIVNLAVTLGIPVIRVPVDGIANPWLHDPTLTKDGQGQGIGGLADHIRRLLVAPRPHRTEEHPGEDLREAYFREARHGGGAGGFYERFLGLIAPVKKPRSGAPEPPAEDLVEALHARWEEDWKKEGVCVEMRTALLGTGIHRHYAWASHLANHYGARYRNAFSRNYMLSWVAVGMAALGVVFHQRRQHELALAAAAGECLLLLMIVLTVRRGSRGHFHARWLDYRRLAEWIRSLPMLLPLSRTPVLGVEADPFVTAEESWVDWMFRAVVREAGVVPLNLSEHLHGAHDILANWVLKGQIAYHERTAARLGRADRVLHRLTKRIFGFALLLAIVNLGELGMQVFLHKTFIPPPLQDPLLVITLVLPALGAALHGLHNQGEFEASTLRSEHIKRRLEELQKELDRIATPSVEGLAGVAVKTATVMNGELGAWFMAYQSKVIGYT